MRHFADVRAKFLCYRAHIHRGCFRPHLGQEFDRGPLSYSHELPREPGAPNDQANPFAVLRRHTAEHLLGDVLLQGRRNELVELNAERHRERQKQAEGNALPALLNVDQARSRNVDKPGQSSLGEFLVLAELLEPPTELLVQLLVVRHDDSLGEHCPVGQSGGYPVAFGVVGTMSDILTGMVRQV